MYFSRKNILFPLVIGELCFLLLFFVYQSISVLVSFHPNVALLMLAGAIIFPFGALLFMTIASYGVRYLSSLYQIAKFALVGVLNTLVDLGVFTLLTALFGAPTLILASIYKIVAFVAAVLNSFFFNKKWVFEGGNKSNSMFSELITFLGVSVGALGVNIVVFVFTHELLTLSNLPEALLNIGAVLTASAAALLWNFLGYKFLVFR